LFFFQAQLGVRGYAARDFLALLSAARRAQLSVVT
jgi:hypothetical protein